MDIKKVIISTEGWDEEEINDLCDIFSTETTIERKKIAQFVSGVEIAIFIAIAIGSGTLAGFSGSIGADIWKKLKGKFSGRIRENKNSSISLKLTDDMKTISFNLKTEDSTLVEKAFDTIDKMLKGSERDTNQKFHFDEKKEQWIKIEESKFSKTVTGVAASTTPVKKGKKTYQIPLEVLKKSAHTLVNTPITLGHGGKEIGKITKAWVEDEKLYYEGGIYETASPEDVAAFERIIQNGGGVSIGMTFPDDEKT